MSETRRSFGFPISVSVRTDVGQVRENNEDSFGHAWLEDGSLFVIVADGMGGHEAGEVASGLAVRVLEDAVNADTDRDPRSRLFEGFLEANKAIIDEGTRSGTRGMGTTAIASILRGNEVHVGLIGDSRLYHVRRGQLVWRTLDHTRVQALIDRGEITEEAGRTHPESGMLTRALGHKRMADGQPLVPDVLADPIRILPNDTLILCSDGLHDLVDDWEVAKLVAGKTSSEAAATLVKLANERGGHDNITVAVIIGGDIADPFDANYVPPVQEVAGAPEPRSGSAAPAPARAPVPGIQPVLIPGDGPGFEVWMLLVAAAMLLLFVGAMVIVGVLLGLYFLT